MSRFLIAALCFCLSSAAVIKEAPNDNGTEIVQELKTELRSDSKSNATDTSAKKTLPVAPAGLAKLVEDSTEAQGEEVKAWPKEVEKKTSAEPIASKTKSDTSFWATKSEENEKKEQAKSSGDALAKTDAAVSEPKQMRGSLKDLESKADTVQKEEDQAAASAKVDNFKKAKQEWHVAEANIIANRKTIAFAKKRKIEHKTAATAEARWLAHWAKIKEIVPVRAKKDMMALVSKPKPPHKKALDAKLMHQNKEFDQQARRCVSEGSACWEAYQGCAQDFCLAFMSKVPKTECFQKALVAYHRLPQEQLAKDCPQDHTSK